MCKVLHQRGVQGDVPYPCLPKVSQAVLTVPWLTFLTCPCKSAGLAFQMPPGTTSPTSLHVALLGPTVACCAGCLWVLCQGITTLPRVQLHSGQCLQVLQHLRGQMWLLWQWGANRGMAPAESVATVVALMPQVCLSAAAFSVYMGCLTLWAAQGLHFQAPRSCAHPGCQCLPALVRWKCCQGHTKFPFQPLLLIPRWCLPDTCPNFLRGRCVCWPHLCKLVQAYIPLHMGSHPSQPICPRVIPPGDVLVLQQWSTTPAPGSLLFLRLVHSQHQLSHCRLVLAQHEVNYQLTIP